MFKNRIRTAAIAGIAALATGLGGFAVPTATAQETLNAPGAPAGDYWESQDASAAYDAEPVNHSEEDLKAASDITQRFIVEGAPDAWRDLQSNLNWDPSEEARASDVRDMHELVTAEQERNAQTINQIQESIAYAYQQDLEATEAWQAVVERAHEISNEIYEEDKAPVANNQQQTDDDDTTYGDILYIPFGDYDTDTDADAEDARKPLSEFEDGDYWNVIDYINFYADRDGHEGLEGFPSALGSNPTDNEVRDFYRDLINVIEDDAFQGLYDDLGEFLFDSEASVEENNEPVDGQRFSRYAANAIIEFYGEAEGYVAELDELLDASADANRAAQQSDVLVRQGFLARAVAQRDLLRNWEGYLLAYARYIELYNDPTLTVDRTLLSTEYREVLDDLERGLLLNTPILITIDDLVTQAFDQWSRDLQTNADVVDLRDGINDDWDFQIVEERLGAAFAELVKIRANGAIWREALNKVQALEIELGQPSDTDRLISAIEDLLGEKDDEETPAPSNPGSGEDEVEGGSSLDIDGSSEGGFGTIGILAGIAAVIGLIAAAVPFLGNFIPNLPF